MRKLAWAVLAAASLILVACNTSGGFSGTRAVKLQAGADSASIESGKAAYSALVADGYHYHFTGRLSNLNVSSANGRTTVVATAAPGDFLNVKLEQIPTDIFELGAAKTTSAIPVACEDCFAGTSAPQPQQTAPPNYGPCVAAGGATWFNQSTGDGGCLGPGSSKGFPCGIWSWDSPGKGRFTTYDGALTGGGFSFISVNPDGQSCHLGN